MSLTARLRAILAGILLTHSLASAPTATFIPQEVARYQGPPTKIIHIDKQSQKEYLYDENKNLLAAYNISTGLGGAGPKQREGDKKTPNHKQNNNNQLYTIISIENSSNWKHPHDPSRKPYGKYFLRLDCGSWNAQGKYDPKGKCSIGLHGTDEPKKLGTIASQGCIRHDESSLESLVNFTTIGETKVSIVEETTWTIQEKKDTSPAVINPSLDDAFCFAEHYNKAGHSNMYSIMRTSPVEINSIEEANRLLCVARENGHYLKRFYRPAAPQKMIDEIIDRYVNDPTRLEDVAQDISKKYNMNVSRTTMYRIAKEKGQKRTALRAKKKTVPASETVFTFSKSLAQGILAITY
ncbi:hypothetical protein D6774_00115 [Candidatus Woesearchaeota archaeon]|nr:MAG: hypothetical protein D6774_00115 [Candidatus Woesearchaeota archaeon]